MTQNGITFTINQDPVFISGGGKIAHENMTDENGLYKASKAESGKITPAVECVDIYWNNAVLPNSSDTGGATKGITTTGQLLNLINEMNKRIYVLTAAVIALSNK